MNLVKKNLVSIICGVVVLLAVAAIFWPVNGYYKDLQTKAAKRGAVAQSIQAIVNNHSRTLPQLVLGQNIEPGTLDVFPTQRIIDLWKASTDKLKDESAQMFKTAVEMNTHPLLVPHSLPVGDPASLIQFRDQYKAEMNLTDVQARDNSIAVTVIKGGFIPASDQIAARRKEVEQNFRKEIGGDPSSDPGLKAQLAQLLEAVPEQLKQEFRQTKLVYLESRALDPYKDIMGLQGGSPEPRKVYIAQVGYWIQRDVLDAIKAANEGSTNVQESAVKHLFSIKLGRDAFRVMEGTLAVTAPVDNGQWPQIDLATATTLTGRTTNPIYDVVRFDVQLYADAEQVPKILQSLSRGRFITVLTCGMQSVDSGAKEALGFYYGSKPIVQLDLTCEELLLREWTKPLMPTTIRTALGIPPEPPKAQ